LTVTNTKVIRDDALAVNPYRVRTEASRMTNRASVIISAAQQTAAIGFSPNVARGESTVARKGR
jgi:hypothetical protein